MRCPLSEHAADCVELCRPSNVLEGAPPATRCWRGRRCSSRIPVRVRLFVRRRRRRRRCNWQSVRSSLLRRLRIGSGSDESRASIDSTVRCRSVSTTGWHDVACTVNVSCLRAESVDGTWRALATWTEPLGGDDPAVSHRVRRAVTISRRFASIDSGVDAPSSRSLIETFHGVVSSGFRPRSTNWFRCTVRTTEWASNEAIGGIVVRLTSS